LFGVRPELLAGCDQRAGVSVRRHQAGSEAFDAGKLIEANTAAISLTGSAACSDSTAIGVLIGEVVSDIAAVIWAATRSHEGFW